MKTSCKYILIALAVMLVYACSKKDDTEIDPCENKHVTTYTVYANTVGEINPNTRAMKSKIKASSDSCQVKEVHLKFRADMIHRGPPTIDRFHEVIVDAFSESNGKANGGGDTLRVSGIYTDTKAAMEALNYVIISINTPAKR